MKTAYFASCCACFLATVVSAPPLAAGVEKDISRGLWIDVYRGEPLGYQDMLDDLEGTGVIYLGEFHTLESHHAIQERLLTDLAKRKRPLVLAMEQLESPQQPTVERYSRGEINFDQFAEAVQWPQSWANYLQYKPVVEAARKLKIPILALNAPAATIRQVRVGGGVVRLNAKLRSQLPKDIQTDDPLYTKLLGLELMVHMSANAKMLRPWFEAQIARDETMADNLCNFLKSQAGRGRSALVLCGNGHIAYGLGTPSRVRRRMRQLTDRIVIMAASGDVKLSPQEARAARAMTLTHDQLRQIDRPISDYLWVAEPKSER